MTAAVALLWPAILPAQNDRFDAAVNEIIANNPTLAARRANMDAEILEMKAENNLSDPEVEFEHQWGKREVGNKWSLSVSQSFDWPGVYHSRSKAVKAGAEASRLLYMADEADMRLRVSQTLADYIAARMQLKLSEVISDNLNKIAEKVTTAYNHGEATVLDYRKICFERIEADAATDAAHALETSLRQELIALNGGKSINLDNIEAFPALDLKSEDYYFGRHRAADPSLLAADYLNEAAHHNVAVASRSALPSFSLGYIHNVEIGDHFNGFSVGMSLPFFSNRHRKAQALAQLEASETNRLAAELEISRRVISEYTAAKNLDKRIAQYAPLFSADAKDDYLYLLRKSFDGSQMTLIMYLYEINYYTEARSAYINLLHDRATAMLSLSRFD